jgi:hypothetical protein
MTISSGIEKNLNFIDDDNDLNIARINLEDDRTCPSTIQNQKRNIKHFSIDGLRTLPGLNMNNTNSTNIERILKQNHMHGNIITDISEFQTNSDHSITDGRSSNMSASPNKIIQDTQNYGQILQNGITSPHFNNLFNDDRRSSYQYSPSIFNAVRELVGSVSKSARNSKDYTNIGYSGGYNFNINLNVDERYILDNLMILLKDQNGCRLIQKKIEEKPHEYIYPMLEKIQTNLVDIINDQFGNYVIQKIIDFIYFDKPLVTKFFELIKRQIYRISVHPCGTRVLQRLLDYLITHYSNVENPTINEVFKALMVHHTYDLIMDTNGNHVFQKVLMIYPKEHNQFIYDELMKVGAEIAKSKKGGCVFQKAFDHASPVQRVYLYLSRNL